MTVDEYREELVTKIKTCRDQRAGQHLINDADSALKSSGFSNDEQLRFWYSLKVDLDNEKARADRVLERQAADSLSAVIAACQAAIAQHQAKITGGK